MWFEPHEFNFVGPKHGCFMVNRDEQVCLRWKIFSFDLLGLDMVLTKHMMRPAVFNSTISILWAKARLFYGKKCCTSVSPMEDILSWPPEDVFDHTFYLSLPLAHRKLVVTTPTNSYWTAGWWPDVVLQMRSDPGVTVLDDEASTGCCWLTDSRSNRKETASQPDTDSSSVSSVTVSTSFLCSWKCRCFLSICLQSSSYN